MAEAHDEEHRNGERTDAAHEDADGETREFARQAPPSFAPHADGKDDDATKRGTKRAAKRRSSVKPEAGRAGRTKRPWWQAIVLTLLVLCGVFAVLYANGSVPGTPRAQTMRQCKDEAAAARNAKRMADLSITDAKKYRDDTDNTISNDDLRRMTVLIDDAEKEPDIPACTISMDNAELSDHAKTSSQLNDVYVTIAKELLRITDGSHRDGDDDADDDRSPSSDQGQEDPIPLVRTTPLPTVTTAPTTGAGTTPSPTASPTPSDTSAPSSTASPSKESTASPKESGSAQPKTPESGPTDAAAGTPTDRSTPTQDARTAQ